MTKIIISANQGGIANRVFSLINTIYIAEKENYDIGLYWDRDVYNRFDLKFESIFDRNLLQVSKETLTTLLKDNNCIIYTNEKLIPPQKDIVRILKSLKLKNKYLQSKPVLVPYDIGFHIRQGDFVDIGISKVSPLELFDGIANNTKKQDTLYLATDDAKVRKRYKDFHSDDSENPMIDLVALADCKKIYCSYGSTFSEFAWYLGECKPERKIVYDEEALKEWDKKKKKTFFKELKGLIYRTFVPLEKRFFIGEEGKND